jgi:thiamine transport system permease protein
VDRDGPALTTVRTRADVRERRRPERTPAVAAPTIVAALAAAPLLFLAVFFVWPVAAIIGRGLSVSGVRDVLTDPGLRQVAWFTLWQAVVSTVLTLVLGLLPAYVLARYRFPGRAVVLALVTVPFVLPTVVVGTAFLALLPSSMDQSVAAILIAHVYFNLAVVIRTVGTLWAQLDPRLEDAARTLGASPFRVLRTVTLPLLRPALLAAASIVFLFTFTSYGVIRVLGGPRHSTLEVEIWRITTQSLDLRTAAALALTQLLAVAALLLWWARLQSHQAVALRLRPRGTSARPRTTGQRVLVWSTVSALVAIVIVPLLGLVLGSFSAGGGRSLAAWRALASGRGGSGPGAARLVDAVGSIGTSLRFAAVATVIALALGAAASCAIGYSRRLGTLLDTGLMLPLGTSAVTVGFGLLITMDRRPLDLRGSWVLIPVAHALVALPFVVRVVLPALRAVEPRLRDAAATLGAPPWRVWRAVDLPVLRRPLLAGAGFAFAISLGEFGATSFLTRIGNETMPLAIARLLGRPSPLNLAQADALATVLMVLTLVAVLAVDRLRGEGGTF